MLPATLPLGACLPVASIGSGQTASQGALATVYEVDFSRLPSQDLMPGGDALKTIDGKNWVLGGTHSVATAAVQNGNGIYLRCNNVNSNDYANFMNSAALYCRHTDLDARLSIGNWTERWSWFNATQPRPPAAIYEAKQVGLVTYSGVYNQVNAAGLNRFYLWRGWNTPGLGYYALANYAGAASAGTPYIPSSAAPDVVVVREIGLSVEIYMGSMVVGAWPDPSALILVGRFALNGVAATPQFEGLGPWVSVMSGNIAGLSDMLFKRLRVQTR